MHWNIRSSRLGVAVALSGWLTACGPSYYLTVRPTERAATDPAAHPTLLAEVDSVETLVSFSHQRGQQVLFDVEVRNGSSRPVLVDPAQFYYEPTLAQPVASATAGAQFLFPRVPAVDPEAQLKQLTTKLATEDRKASGVSGWEWLALATDLAADLSATKRKETPQQEYERKVQHDQTMQSFDDNRARHAEEADRTALETELWQHKMLRRYSLQPGELVRGYVVFPALEQSAQLRLEVPLGARSFTFDFTQERRKY